MTKITELRELGAGDLERRESELADQLFRLRLQHSMGQQEAAGKLQEGRRDLARVAVRRRPPGTIRCGLDLCFFRGLRHHLPRHDEEFLCRLFLRIRTAGGATVFLR